MAATFSNSELGEELGMSASGASYLRSGQRLPSPEIQQIMSIRFGIPLKALNAAMVMARRGDVQPWLALMNETIGPPNEPQGPVRDWGVRRVMCRRCGAKPKQLCRTASGELLEAGQEHQQRRDAALRFASAAID